MFPWTQNLFIIDDQSKDHYCYIKKKSRQQKSYIHRLSLSSSNPVGPYLGAASLQPLLLGAHGLDVGPPVDVRQLRSALAARRGTARIEAAGAGASARALVHHLHAAHLRDTPADCACPRASSGAASVTRLADPLPADEKF